MNIQHAKSFILISLICVISACGGGGGGNDSLNVSGNWTGALTKTTDTCTPANPQTVNFTHSVSQNESAVTLNSSDGLRYLGNVVGDNGFSVDASGNVQIGNATCTKASRIEYDQVETDSDETADVKITSTITCTGPGGCETVYEGTASRSTIPASGTATATPRQTAQPGQTATPVSTGSLQGGCVDINPNPANDTYNGDGSCGISDVLFRFQQESTEGVVTLEPFGANGLTSFVVSPTNTSTAASRRTDLTINGQAGYTCTMTCSPTATFTVRCVREGGDSCVEKF